MLQANLTAHAVSEGIARGANTEPQLYRDGQRAAPAHATSRRWR